MSEDGANSDFTLLYNGSDGNLTGNETSEMEMHHDSQAPWWLYLLVQVLYAIVCIVGLCGNTLVIYVVYRFSKMKTVTNLYLVNLAIADECFLVGIPFLITTASLGYWPFGKMICKVYFTTTSINQFTSSMFLLIMSADRYLAVCHPINAPKYRTPLIAKFVALTAWTLSALFMVPIFMYASTVELEIGKAPDIRYSINCNIFWPDSGFIFNMNGQKTFTLYSFFLGFAIPLILIMVFYVLVILRLRTVGPKRRGGKGAKGASEPNNQTNNRAKERKKSHRKVTKLVLTVITIYFLCWFPYWMAQLILIYSEGHTSNIIFLLVGCLSYSNSAMNPILYAFLSDNFKKSFLKACTCAGRQDGNAVLHIENSVFPRKKSGSECRQTGSKGASSSRLVNSIPPKIQKDDDFDSEDEGAAILKKSYEDSAMTSRSGVSEISKITQETFIQDGVHVTAL